MRDFGVARLQPDEPENDIGSAVQNHHWEVKQPIGPEHRESNRERAGFRPADGKALGGQLAKKNVKERDDQKGKRYL